MKHARTWGARTGLLLGVVGLALPLGLTASNNAHADGDNTCPTTAVGSFNPGPSDAPAASCLLSFGDDVDSGYSPPTAGVQVNITSPSLSMVGLATDGTEAYMLNSDGNIVTTDLTSLPTPSMSSGTVVNVTGTSHTVDWSNISGGFGSLGDTTVLSIAYSHGSLFITNDVNGGGQGSTPPLDTDTAAIFSTDIHLYYIDTSNYTAYQVPDSDIAACPMPLGHYYTQSSLIEFPDGRIGKVSEYLTNNGAYTNVSRGGYTSVLRTYDVSGSGSAIAVSCSNDYVMHDTEDFGNDEHGIATDGTYLYRVEWHSPEPPFYDHPFNSWQLSSSSVPDPTYQGFYAMPFGNMQYLTYNPTDDYYIMGEYTGSGFYITPEADPGPGPGNPLTPTFGTVTRTIGGYTVPITNYDSSYTWTGSSTAGSVSISSSGLVTVSGLSPDQTTTLTINNSQSGYPDGSASTSGQALGNDLNGDGIDDSTQAYVADLTNAVTGEAAAVQVGSDCTLSNTSAEQASSAGSDPGYSYPLGMLNFTASCGAPGFTTTVTQYYYDPPDGSFVLRKVINGKFETVTNATLNRETIDGQPVLEISYPVTDGGPLDADGAVNGVVVDPAGPALQDSSTSLSDTGVQITVVSGVAVVLFTGAVGVRLAATRKRSFGNTRL